MCFYDPSTRRVLDGHEGNVEQQTALRRVIMFLGICHTIIIDEKKGTYNAASPDELALVNFAKQMGFIFRGIDNDDCLMLYDEVRATTYRYKLLHICEFTSSRKRASVIVRDEQTGEIKLLCKGADSVIMDRMSTRSKNSQVMKETTRHVDGYAREGLRTLFLAERTIDESDFTAWYKGAE